MIKPPYRSFGGASVRCFVERDFAAVLSASSTSNPCHSTKTCATLKNVERGTLMKNKIWLSLAGLFVIFTAWQTLFGEKPPPPPQPAEDTPTCVRATGRIWSGAKLYQDSECKTLIGTVAGGSKTDDGRKSVRINFANGETEDNLRCGVGEQ
jgi:hypothetical protein